MQPEAGRREPGGREQRGRSRPLPAAAARKRKAVEVACALIERGGRVLVAQRGPGQAHAGAWEFPGGKLEPGEDAAAALEREIREELGVEIAVGESLPAAEHDYGAFTVRLMAFVCALRRGEPRPREHAAVRWCTPGEIGALALTAADEPVLRSYRQRAGRGGKRA
jgi:8-oxo-dGTP diphosphatase